MLSRMWLISLLWAISKCDLDFYLTNNGQHDCLYYYSTDSEILTKTEYCIRPDDDSPTTIIDFPNMRDENFTFNQLFDMNITAYQILLWSHSMDVAEQYDYYISHPDKSLLSNKIFFNCTRPWFGSRCEYSFELDETQSVLDSHSNYPFGIYTCYILLECNRGELPMCLDWREICDGRIDCLNDGVDEAQCFDLEINECKANEYRCHNGLCIPDYYWKYERSTAECLDQSDLSYTSSCPNVVSTYDLFHCEERTCSPGGNKFSCGDGQCVEDFDECQNGRHLMLLKSMSFQGDLSHPCWIAMICLTKIINEAHGVSCKELLPSDVILYLNTCDDYIQFPINPILFGHVRFLYRRKEINELNINSALIPDYICYDEQLCNFLIPTFRYEWYACRHAHQMGLKSNAEYRNWKSIIDVVKPYFYGCNIRYNDKIHSSLYLCRNSSKYISKYRILDNISDCYLEDDERDFELSCSINDPYRFKCPNEIQCRSPIVSPTICPLIEQPIQEINQILFNQICDGTVDILLQLIDGQNHTDETNCEHWPCNNIYTRCDGNWDCPYGEDEENCRPSKCSRQFLDCLSPHNFTMICLPASQVRNGIVDCLGGLDELQLCRMANYYDGISYKFRCLNDAACTEPSAVCNLHDDCLFNKDRTFCPKLCDEWTFYNYTEIQNNLCRNRTLAHTAFTLKSIQIYPPTEDKMIDYISDSAMKRSTDKNNIKFYLQGFTLSSHCIRGIPPYLWLGNQTHRPVCLCPANYYGNMCQYQNQRISLTLTLLAINIQNIYRIFVKVINDDDDRQEINSYAQIIYVSGNVCKHSFNTYLLYSTRPKNLKKTYSIHIDAYDMTSFTYLAGWYFKVPFHFLPVNRLAVVLTLGANETSKPNLCSLKCQQGTCLKCINEKKFFCRCNTGWSGAHCHIPIDCNNCSSDSLCMGNAHNRSICLCPLEKFGTFCNLKHSCPENYCENRGRCIVISERISDSSYKCLCSEEFVGSRCEIPKAKVHISFHNTEVALYLMGYIYSYVSSDPPPVEEMVLKKLTRMQRNVKLYLENPFQMVFIVSDGSYYLAVLRQVIVNNISTSIDSTRRCPSINELLKSELLKFPRIRRVKLYHTLCENHPNMECFFDETYMCLCTTERYANCFPFNHQHHFQCTENVYCQNDAQCLQDDPTCPVSTICICTDCFFGDRCEFYAKGIGLTLDDILRYGIRPNIRLHHQSALVKVSITLSVVLFVVAAFNSLFSFVTFRRKNVRKLGCGIYLFASSINSILTITMLQLKFWFVIITQAEIITNRAFLRAGCFTLEPLLKTLLWMNNWLNACVAIERAVNTFYGPYFSARSSRYYARRIIVLLLPVIIASNIYECLFRDLFNDYEENQVWCTTLYSASTYIYTTTILFFHFFVPFFINLFSAIFIIVTVTGHRVVAQTRRTWNQHLKEQLNQHKKLIISPFVQVILTLPVFVISLLFRCIRTPGNSWLYLFTYFLSFIPPTLTFVIYVLPSEAYMLEFQQATKKPRARIKRFLGIDTSDST